MSIKSFLQNIRIRVGKFFLDKKSETHTDFAINKILFLRQDGKIGDYIVSSFVFRELKKLNPNIQIGVVCTKKDSYLFQQNSYIDKLYFVKKRDILDYIKCGLKLRKEQYDVVIDPTIFIRNRDLLFLRLINAKNYVGYKKEHYALFNINIDTQKIHFNEIYRRALELIGFNHISTQYDIPVDQQSAEDISLFLTENKLASYIVVNFFGAGSARRFSNNAMKALLDHLTNNTTHIVLLTFPEVTDKLQQLAKNYKNILVYEKTHNIFHTIELIKHANAVISPDTSIVHIAAGFHKPLIAFYSQDEENFVNWHPNNQAETHIFRFEKSVNEIDFTQIKTEWLQAR